ncbi:hypothetical protein CEXT_152741 [Caerostris extrusa]|uniref:Uncharacterized protein n=1 Tax=Caerostris extrusa TaxID=172846 RepID=A0AAV4TCJ9_CAEEX|nr:hypothetical protein CEXT_152741 [Caerostris extrusa]
MDDRAPRFIQGRIHGDERGGAFEKHGIECSNGSTRSSLKVRQFSVCLVTAQTSKLPELSKYHSLYIYFPKISHSLPSNKVSTHLLETQNPEIKTNKSGILSSHFSTEKGEPLGPEPSQTFSLFDILSETPSTFHYRYSDALTSLPP